MSETSAIMNALRSGLAAAYPARRVTRALLDFADRPEGDLLAGIYTLVAGDEDGFPNYRGREGNFGDLQVGVIAQIKVSEQARPDELEDAESVMVDEIKAYTRSVLPAPIDSLVLTAVKRSRQLEHPYGWVLCDMQVMLG